MRHEQATPYARRVGWLAGEASRLAGGRATWDEADWNAAADRFADVLATLTSGEPISWRIRTSSRYGRGHSVMDVVAVNGDDAVRVALSRGCASAQLLGVTPK